MVVNDLFEEIQLRISQISNTIPTKANILVMLNAVINKVSNDTRGKEEIIRITDGSGGVISGYSWNSIDKVLTIPFNIKFVLEVFNGDNKYRNTNIEEVKKTTNGLAFAQLDNKLHFVEDIIESDVRIRYIRRYNPILSSDLIFTDMPENYIYLLIFGSMRRYMLTHRPVREDYREISESWSREYDKELSNIRKTTRYYMPMQKEFYY